MWQTYRQSKDWGQRPSEILRIENAYVGYCVDEAVWVFGGWVDDQVESAGESAGRKNDTNKKAKVRMQRAFEKCMGLEPKFRPIG